MSELEPAEPAAHAVIAGQGGGLIAWFARNPVAANLLMVACLIGGIAGYLTVDREVFPNINPDSVSIDVSWPGASPQDVEEQIVQRIEEAIADIDGVDAIISNAVEGQASVIVEAKRGVSLTSLFNDVKSQVDGVGTFPVDAFSPVVRERELREELIYIGLYGDAPERVLTRLAIDLRDELAQLPGGSALVEVSDARKEELAIEVSETALRRYGLSFDDVARAVGGGSVNLSSGAVQTETGDVQLRARALADTRSDFENIVIRQSIDGALIRIRDVATVIDGFEERRRFTRLNGKRALTITVLSPSSADVTQISRAVEGWVDRAEERLPAGVEIFVWWDFATLYFERISLVAENAVIGLALVLVVLLLFLRLTVAFWTAVGIAIAFSGAFMLMPATDVSLNMLSLFALLLALGIVVDDAIIVGESIHRQVEQGRSGLDAAITGARLVAKPVIFAVLTTIIAFLPWLFLSGAITNFTRHISITIALALIFSLVEAFLILPAHLRHMGLRKRPTDAGFNRAQSAFSTALRSIERGLYRPALIATLRHRYAAVIGFVMAFLASVSLVAANWVEFRFSPKIETSFVEFIITMPDGSPFSRNLEIHAALTKAIDDVNSDLKELEGNDIILVHRIDAQPTQIDAFMRLTPSDERQLSAEAVGELLRQALGPIPDAEEIAVQTTFNDTGPDIRLGVEASDLDALRLAVDDLKSYFRGVGGAYDIRDSLQSATDELRISLKPGAERFGLTLHEVSRQVRQGYFGEEVQRLPRGGQDIRVMVRYPRQTREAISSLADFRIRINDGQEVLLFAVADVTYAPSYKRVQRRDRTREATVGIALREGVQRSTVMRDFRRAYLPQWRALHPTARYAERGDQKEEKQFINELQLYYSIALFAMYALLAVAFGSYWQPLLIMSAVPFGFMGAVVGLMAFGFDMDLFAVFGIGAAAGVVINDNLVLIDSVNRLRARGVEAFSALTEAGSTRFRPIVLTSLTTFIGLLPIMFEDSLAAAFLKAAVVALAFGIFFATFVTLIFVPALYAIGVDAAQFLRRFWMTEPLKKTE
ncbi:MAG: efflux RND transporter permease subunit [Pseudomonadota bacterium]